MTQRLSTTEKHVRGTLRKDRAPKRTAADRLRIAPKAPDSLSEGAKSEWAPLARAVVELGVLTTADLRALALLAECLATESELRDTLEREGLTIAGAGGNRKAHPGAKLLETTRGQAMRLLADFGLTPRGRMGVDVRPLTTANVFAVNGTRSADRYFDGPKPWDHHATARRK